MLQLQDIMTVDNNQSETIPNTSNEFTIDVPTAIARSTQRKTRAKPMHEIQANVASKKLGSQFRHSVFLRMFLGPLIRYRSMGILAETFTAVSVIKVIW